MNNLRIRLNEIAERSFSQLGLDTSQAFFVTSQRPELSDYQCNAAMVLAKTTGEKPRDLATRICTGLENEFKANKIPAQFSIDGPGFVNVKLDDSAIVQALELFEPATEKSDRPETIIIDHGGPNIAKAMHVGHIRTSIVGESIKRILRAQGHKVLGDIHWGDWGTQMGILIALLEQEYPNWPYFNSKTDISPDLMTHSIGLTLNDFGRIYPEGAARFKVDPEFADTARRIVKALQDGNAGYRALWKQLVDVTEPAVKEDLSRLRVDFDLWFGESTVNDEIPQMLAELKSKELIMEHEGALIFPVELESDKHDVPPLILEKSGGDVEEAGGYTYATTDLATIRMRVREYKPDRILYVVDTRQQLHFMQVFRAAELAGYIKQNQLEFLGIGTINGPDGKPFKTRAGGVMRLTQLLDLAYEAAAKKSGVDPKEHDQTVEAISVAALKFQDLRINRAASYNFEPDAATQHEGKTGPYIQYGAARIYSILDKAQEEGTAKAQTGMEITAAEERALALKLLAYPDVLTDAAHHRAPSDICSYVYETVQLFSSFYQNCPVLSSAVTPAVRSHRLYLLRKTLSVLQACANLIGFELPERIPGSTN
jgi:arginyl-tRNA synthetase